MEDNKKVIDIKNKYSMELQEIKNKLHDLEVGRIYELTRVQQDGYLAKNISDLRQMLNKLINKIEFEKDSTSDDLGKIFD